MKSKEELELENIKLNKKIDILMQAINQSRVIKQKFNESTKLLKQKDKELKELNRNLEAIVLESKNEKDYIQTVVESNNNAIIAINWNGKITTYNKKAQEIFGWTKEEMIGTQNLLNIVPDKYKNDYIKGLADYFKNGKLSGILDDANQLEALHKDGTVFPIRISIGSKFKSRDTIVIANISDITEEIRQKETLLRTEKMASMGDMIGNIAHQWRQPLSVISTASTGIIMQKQFGLLDEKELVNTCSTINNNAQYLSKTIDDFRNFIKGDSKKELFNLENEIDSFLHLVEGSIKNYHINIVLDLQKDIQIDGYENERTQCIINIFNNAKDILNEKKIENKLILISTSNVKDKAIIKIKDNAGGIPKDVLPKIFEPYFTTKHKSQGTGLGLHMSYNLIVDGMGGTIEAHNVCYEYNGQEYTGAEFVISLPMN